MTNHKNIYDRIFHLTCDVLGDLVKFHHILFVFIYMASEWHFQVESRSSLSRSRAMVAPFPLETGCVTQKTSAGSGLSLRLRAMHDNNVVHRHVI